MKLHLGCGTNRKDGWINIDSVKACQPDVVHDLTEPLPYSDLIADEVLAEDLLEHFDKYIRYIVFAEWVRVLKIGGILTLQVPDMEKILWRFFKLGFDHFVDMTFGENLWNSKIYIGHFGNHKWGYSKKSLQDFAATFGIIPVHIETVGLNIRFIGQKEQHVTLSDLDNLKIHSHANRCGPGPDYATLQTIREKIQIFKADNKE